MADNKKLVSPIIVAQEVLKKVHEVLANSDLMKAEKLKKDQPSPTTSPSPASQISAGFGNATGSSGISGAMANLGSAMGMGKKEGLKKYETENNKNPAVKYGKLETDQKATERDYKEYEVKPASFKDSSGPRVATQISPSKNPKEEAEGNNKPDGMEPPYEFKDKVKGELAKEKAALAKKENPDKNADAKLGEKVEKEVEKHFKENKAAEAKEGHKLMVKSDGESKFKRCVEGVKENSPEVKSPEGVCVAEGVKPEQQKTEQDKAVIPRLILSAKLAKFCEHMHSKRKNAEAQSVGAVGHDGPDAPAPRSTQASEPEIKKSYEGFKAVESSAAKSGASDPAAVAAAAGMKKYGKKKFEEAAHEGKKLGKK